MAKTPRFSGKMRPMRLLRMSYGCLTVVLRWSYDYILISQMLKFRQKRYIKRPDFRKKRVLFESYSSPIRVLCVFTSSLLHVY